jgi:hypothetical protein
VTGVFKYTVNVTDKDGHTGSKGCSVVTSPNTPFRTQTQGGWGAKPAGKNPGAFLAANFANAFPAGVRVGGQPWTILLSSAAKVEAFLPQGGTPAALKKNHVNPTSTEAGVFAGQVLTLQLSVGFSNAAITRYGLGDLKVKAGKLAGKTVSEVLNIANAILGGGALPASVSISDINGVVDAINNNFDDGKVDRGYLVK